MKASRPPFPLAGRLGKALCERRSQKQGGRRRLLQRRANGGGVDRADAPLDLTRGWSDRVLASRTTAATAAASRHADGRLFGVAASTRRRRRPSIHRRPVLNEAYIRAERVAGEVLLP